MAGNNDLESTLKFVMDEDGTVAVRDLAGNVKELASAADLAAERARKMGQEFAKSASGAEVPIYQSRSKARGEESRAAKAREKEEADYQNRLQGTVKAMELRNRLSADMRRMGYGDHKSAFETVTSGAGLGGSPLGTLGRGFSAGGGTAAIATAAKEAAQVGMEYAASLSRIDSTPFMSEAGRREANRRAIPVFGSAYGQAVDAGRYFTGESKFIRESSEHAAFASTRVHKSVSELRFGAFDATEAEAARNRSARVGGLSAVEPAGHDRSSVLGRRLYEEELRTLPHQQELRRAIADRTTAEEKAAAYTRMLTDKDSPVARRERELRERDGQLETAIADVEKRGSNSSDVLYEQDLKRQRAEVKDEIDQINGVKREIAERAKGARDEATGALEREQAAKTGAAQSRYEIAAGREARVENQSERLGRMSDSELAAGKVAAEFVKANKDNLGVVDEQTRSQAERYAPELLQQLYKERGERQLADAGRVSPEYDQTSRKAARDETDAAAKALRDQQVNAAGEIAAAYSRGVSELVDILAPLFKQANRDAKAKLETQMQVGAAQRAASPNQPGS